MGRRPTKTNDMNKKNGFSLLELLIVVAIILIIATIAIPSLLRSRQAANDMGTVRPKNPLGDYLPGPPIATRDFRQGDTVTIFAEVYENARSPQVHQVAIKTELRTDEGRVVANTLESRSSSELQGKSGGYGFTSDLPLKGIAPGLYVLHVEAQSQIEGSPTAARDIQ